MSTVAWALFVLYGSGVANAQRISHSTSFDSCQDNTTFTATKFDAALNPDNSTLVYSLVGLNTFSGNVTIDLSLISNGEAFYSQTLDPCDSLSIAALCPSHPGQITLEASQEIPESLLDQLPAQLRFEISDKATDRTIACVEARFASGVGESSSGTTTPNPAGQPTTSSSPSDSGSDRSDDSSDVSNSSDSDGSSANTILSGPSMVM